MPATSTQRRLDRARGRLASDAIARMEAYPWFRALDADQRSWVGVIAQAGINAFVDWYSDHASTPHPGSEVFGSAPRELVRAVTLRQTVELVRTTIDVVEEQVEQLAAPGDETELREAVLRYGREIAFASAQIYAQAAEARGAWDARLEALVVDALMRGEIDEAVRSRAAALGWHEQGAVMVVMGTAPSGDPEEVVEVLRRAARHARLDVLAGVQGDRLVAVLGRIRDRSAAAKAVVDCFGDGPVVMGPEVSDILQAPMSAGAAASGLRAATAWPDAPRPTDADDLLTERALAGDAVARSILVRDVAGSLRGSVRETVEAYLATGSIEGAARRLFVHTNTVRYRLRRAAELTGQVVTSPRGGHAVRIALALERLKDAAHPL